MDQSHFDLLLHPVRMQVIQTLVAGRRMTAQEIGERMPEVAQATLYRHLRSLVEGSVLEVVEERRVRGAVERVYAVRGEQLAIPPAELARATAADHMRYFTTFVAGLLGSFGRYLRRPWIDLANDGVGYRLVTLNLTREELGTFIDDLNTRLHRELDNEPSAGRRPYAISRIVIPEEAGPPGPDS